MSHTSDIKFTVSFSSHCLTLFLIHLCHRAVFILALVITIAVVVTRSDDDQDDQNAINDNPARPINSNEFYTLMQAFGGPINGNLVVVLWSYQKFSKFFHFLTDEQFSNWSLDEPEASDIKGAIDEGIIALGNRELFEENLQMVPVNSPSFRHQRAVSTTADARKLARRGYIENHATNSLAKR